MLWASTGSRLATAQLVGALRRFVSDANSCHLMDGLLDILPREAVDQAPGGVDVPQPPGQHVGEHRRAVDQIEVLKDHAESAADAAHLVGGGGGNVVAIPHDSTFSWLYQPVDAAQQG